MALHIIQQLLNHADAQPESTGAQRGSDRRRPCSVLSSFAVKLVQTFCRTAVRRTNRKHADGIANVLSPEQLERGAGDGDRTRDQQLGKL